VLELTGEASTAEVPPAETPTHVPAEVTTTHRTAEVSAAHSAPMTGSAATARNGVGRDGGTSQCRGNDDDRKSVQHRFRHGGYLLAARSASAELSDARKSMYLPTLRSVCSVLRQLSPTCGNLS
jgi:hypothetical protein